MGLPALKCPSSDSQSGSTVEVQGKSELISELL
jgi:hypothetical protein